MWVMLSSRRKGTGTSEKKLAAELPDTEDNHNVTEVRSFVLLCSLNLELSEIFLLY